MVGILIRTGLLYCALYLIKSHMIINKYKLSFLWIKIEKNPNFDIMLLSLRLYNCLYENLYIISS